MVHGFLRQSHGDIVQTLAIILSLNIFIVHPEHATQEVIR